MCGANARPGAPGRIDCRIFPSASGFTPKALSLGIQPLAHRGPNVYPAWRLRPEYLPSSASCSGVRGGAAFVPRSIALSRVGSVYMRIIL